ncbi:AAA family ATPase [Pinirhizobacter soli]|uniref:AAA family ATPase n=1 Tax=Pinirhizobacter soli TaxID=2786953 RepID=UPI00202A004E|nr:AAA family ATPase [Pinirhizobacter soli]
MITGVSINGYKSFEPGKATMVPMAPHPKRVSLFYGLNGSGKTAIGQVIDRHGRGEPVPHCTVTVSHQASALRYAVYNEDFVDAHFRSVAACPGIFTVGKLSAETLSKKDALESRLEIQRAEHQEVRSQMAVIDQRSQREIDTLTQTVYQSYQPIKQSALSGLFNLGRDRAGWLTQVQATTKPAHEPVTWDELLAQHASLIGSQATSRSPVVLDLDDISQAIAQIEPSAHWAAPIVASGDSRLAPFIEMLGNQDWVRSGQHYLEPAHGDCPFCQRALPTDFPDALAQLFDKRYDRALHEVTLMREAYVSLTEKLQRRVADALAQEPFAADHPIFGAVARRLVDHLRVNLSRLNDKLARPGEKIELVPSQALVDDLHRALDEVNTKIRAHNARLEDVPKAMSAIRATALSRARWEQDAALAAAASVGAMLNEQRSAEVEHSNALRAAIAADEAEHANIVKEETGVDHSVKAINARLKQIGILAFSIKKAGPTAFTYAIAREGDQPDEFRSLSEGEKTLITFLYFLETLTGAADPDLFFPASRTIVVIDDPISSLSQNYVFDVADLVGQVVGYTDPQSQPFAQVIVLTHNLYFFHELLHPKHQIKDHAACFRVRKNTWSSVVALDAKKLRNDYEGLWWTVREARDGVGTVPGLANAMRQILETFFTFTSMKKTVEAALDALKDEETNFKPFYRFVSRESHADGDTITDFGDFELSDYVDRFRRVFDRAGFPQHFDFMMAHV